MRRTRRLFLLAIAVIVACVGGVYYVQRAQMIRAAPRAPRSLPTNVRASSSDWCYREDEGGVPKVEICARDMERVDGPATQVKLRFVELKLFHKDGKVFDRVKSASAEFDESAGVLFSDGEVEIMLAVPVDGAPKGRLLTIRSSGVRFEQATGKATTEREASFSFDLGEGRARGAVYDPSTRQLELMNDVALDWRGGEGKTPMRIESGRLTYRESESKVYLAPWSRLTREKLRLEGGDAVVTLEDGAIRLVEARQARGADEYPSRRLEFGADDLRMEMTPKSEIEKIAGTGNARLDAVSASGRTLVTGDRVDLAFRTGTGESVLESALVNGKGAVDSTAAGNRARRVMRSQTIAMKMRAGGEELESVETYAPAELDLIAPEAKRHVTAERLGLAYGGKNQLRSARATGVATRTERPAKKGEKPPPPALTSSKDLLAEFDEKTGEMTRLKQWTDFEYQEGEQRARAAEATMEGRRIALENSARVWDASGSVAASRIVLRQDTGDFTAENEVRSSRLPDPKSGAGGGMLAPGEPVLATADRMVSAERNRRIVYEGKAVLWQEGTRLQADRVLIDRGSRNLEAAGNVVSQFLDRPPAGKAKRKDAEQTTIRAASLHYNDREKLAWYRGGVRLVRDRMDVKSAELRAWLKQEESKEGDSRLDRAFADGAVEIVQAEPNRTRRGSAEHAEYYVGEEKVVLYGGHPQMIDSVKGTTRGQKLTYWANSDSFQGDGAPTQPAVSRIKRK